MRLLQLLLLFISQALFAQDAIIELKIDSVTSSDSIPDQRKYVVNYHIKNLTDKKISFLLNTSNSDTLKGVQTNRISYNLYQDNVLVSDFWFGKNYDYATLMKFINGLRNSKTLQEEEVIKNDPEFKKFKIHPIYVETLTNKRNPDYKVIRKFENTTIYNTMKTFEPNETRNFQLVLYWNKERYFKNETSEFYLSEDQNYELGLTFTTFDYDYMYFNLTEGLVHDESLFFNSKNTSNKVSIDFR